MRKPEQELFNKSYVRCGLSPRSSEKLGDILSFVYHLFCLFRCQGSHSDRGIFVYLYVLSSKTKSNHMPEDVIMTQAATDDEFAIRVAAVQPVHTNMRLAGVGLLFVLAAALGITSDNRRNLARLLLLAALIAVLVI